MAVLPEYQRKAYESKLIEKGLEILTERDYWIVVVLGHPDYYPKFGFVQADQFGIQCEYDCPAEAFMVKEIKSNSLKGVSGTVYYSSKFSEA